MYVRTYVRTYVCMYVCMYVLRWRPKEWQRDFRHGVGSMGYDGKVSPRSWELPFHRYFQAVGLSWMDAGADKQLWKAHCALDMSARVGASENMRCCTRLLEHAFVATMCVM